MEKHDGNVVFKCTYNDGGTEGYLGFGGTCSVGNIVRNVQTHPRVWCSSKNNECRQFYENDFFGKCPKNPCYESRLLYDWKFSAGCTHPPAGTEGKPLRIKQAKEGKIVLFTTRLPKLDDECKQPRRNPESSRIVFAISKIREIYNDEEEIQWVQCDRRASLRLTESAALALPYWKFKKSTRTGYQWGSGLFRYISDEEIAHFLSALYPLLKSADERAVLEKLAHSCGGIKSNPIDLLQNNTDLRKLESAQKYGPGGEGEKHRNLKEAIHKKPEILKLGKGCATMEHRFRTGDRVDVLVELNNGEHCVVEVEVEGRESTLTGAHQALKYRALCAGHRNPKDSTTPLACLVAYSIPREVKEFCQHHDIKTLEFKEEEVNRLLCSN